MRIPDGAFALLLISIAHSFFSQASASDQTTWRLDNLESIGDLPVTLEGDPKLIDTPHGKAIEFDGQDDAVFIETHPLSGMDTFTVEIIFNPYSGGGAEQRFFHMQEEGSASRVMFETRLPEKNRWFLDTFIKSGENNSVLYAQDHLHETDQWRHAAIVYDGETMSHYVDGSLELSAPLAYAPQQDGRTSIGVRINKVDWFKGAVRTIRFSTRPLPPGEFLSNND